MNIRKWVILITVFLIANTYYDGKFTDYLILGKKYYKMEQIRLTVSMTMIKRSYNTNVVITTNT